MLRLASSSQEQPEDLMTALSSDWVSQKVTHREAALGKETPWDLVYKLLNLHTPIFKAANNGADILFFFSWEALWNYQRCFGQNKATECLHTQVTHITHCTIEYHDCIDIVRVLESFGGKWDKTE